MLIGYSVVCRVCRIDPLPHHTGLVSDGSRRRAEDTSDGPRPFRGFDVDLTSDGYCQERGGETSPRLNIALQTRARYTKQCAGRMDCLYRSESAHLARGMAQLPQWPQ